MNVSTTFANSIHPLTGQHQSTWVVPDPVEKRVTVMRVRKRISTAQLMRNFIRDHPGKSCYEVAEGLGMPSANVSSTLSSLEKAGYLTSERGKHRSRRGDTKFYSIRENA